MIFSGRVTLTVMTIALLAACTCLSLYAQELDNKPRAVLLDGMGVYSRPISTKSIAVQKFFDQGLNLTFSYYFVHAAASYQEAIRLDPNHPMPHWGLALAIGPNPNSRYLLLNDDPKGEGKRAIERAMALRDGASPVEQKFIDALYVRYDHKKYPDRADRDEAYAEVARKLYQEYPNDLEAGFLYADALMTKQPWTYWNRDGIAVGSTLAAAVALDRTLAQHPLHPGANHLAIHLHEASSNPKRAEPNADRLAALMPHAGHIVHMPSHIFIRTGRYQDAIDTNMRAYDVDSILLKQWGDLPHPLICSLNNSALVHGAHATDYIRYAATFQGDYALANEYAKKSVVPADMISSNQRSVVTPWLVHKIFGKWEALEKEARPPAGHPYLEGIWRYVQGSRLLHKGDLKSAKTALAELEKYVSDADMPKQPIRTNHGSIVLAVAASGLAGEIALTSGDTEAAIEFFQKAVDLEEDLGYVEPPDWAQSMKLYLGNAYLVASKPEKAESVFRKDLEWWPENGWALFGLWKSLDAQGKTSDAVRVKEQFEAAWKNSDVHLEAPVF